MEGLRVELGGAGVGDGGLADGKNWGRAAVGGMIGQGVDWLQAAGEDGLRR